MLWNSLWSCGSPYPRTPASPRIPGPFLTLLKWPSRCLISKLAFIRITWRACWNGLLCPPESVWFIWFEWDLLESVSNSFWAVSGDAATVGPGVSENHFSREFWKCLHLFKDPLLLSLILTSLLLHSAIFILTLIFRAHPAGPSEALRAVLGLHCFLSSGKTQMKNQDPDQEIYTPWLILCDMYLLPSSLILLHF